MLIVIVLVFCLLDKFFKWQGFLTVSLFGWTDPCLCHASRPQQTGRSSPADSVCDRELFPVEGL